MVVRGVLMYRIAVGTTSGERNDNEHERRFLDQRHARDTDEPR